ncbi:MAG: serine/threonine-protein kinase [Isosphaeraceae bacterium]
MPTHDPTHTTVPTRGDGPTLPAPTEADATQDQEQGLPATSPAPDPDETDGRTLPGVVDARPDDETGTFAQSAPTPVVATPVVPGYEVLAKLGEGGMGVVWKARQTKLNRLVALKMVLGDQRAGSKELIRFLAEAEAVAAVKHAHVVQVYEYGEAGGRPFLAMEYLPGGSLKEKLQQAGRLEPKAAARLVGTLAEAVQAAHDQGIVHRDLKPANVLYDEQGRPRVMDFGLAKRAGGSDLTATQAVMGTPAYMAPEQARGDTKFVGPQADVYALGVILYQCLTGTRPFEAPDQVALLRKVAEDDPEPPGPAGAGPAARRRVDLPEVPGEGPCRAVPHGRCVAADLGRFASGNRSAAVGGVVERSGPRAQLQADAGRRLHARLAGGAARRPRAGPLAVAGRGTGPGLGGIRPGRGRAAAGEVRAVRVRPDDAGSAPGVGATIPAATLALLDGTRTDLRGWEWRYVHSLCHSDLLTPPRAYLTRQLGIVQPGRIAGRHREFRWTGCRDGRSGRRDPDLERAHQCRQLGFFQPGRVAGRHRVLGRDGQGAGHAQRCRDPDPPGARHFRLVGFFQPGRVAGHHRRRGRDGQGVGRAKRAPRS